MIQEMDCNIQNLESKQQTLLEPHCEQSLKVLPSKTITHSRGDFAEILTGAKHFSTPKTSNEFTGIEQTEIQSEVQENRPTKYDDVGIKLKAELSRYKKELRDYNNTTKDLEEKYRKINTELNEMQQKHERFVAKRKSTKPHPSSSMGSECVVSSSESSSSQSCVVDTGYSIKQNFTKVFCEGTKYPINDRQFTDDDSYIRHGQQSSTPRNNEYGGLRIEALRHLPNKERNHKRIHKDVNDDLLIQGEHGLNAVQEAGMKDIYKALKTMMNNRQKTQVIGNYKTTEGSSGEDSEISGVRPSGGGVNMHKLHTIVTNLQSEHSKSNALIQQQRKCLHEYHSRCAEAQKVVQTQQQQIKHLHTNNSKLEAEFTAGIEQLRIKIDAKLKEVAQLPKMIRDERDKSERSSRENKALSERLRNLQLEAAQLKAKLEDLTKKKTLAIARLKAAGKDLKIFKNHNLSLKLEKKKLSDELARLKEQMAGIQMNNKRMLSRQRESFEKQRRDLQKRIYDLEVKLSRSQKSTTGIIQERDRLIAELQAQLNTLVHNFEVSQKHIRVLRRHIYNAPNNVGITPGLPPTIRTGTTAANVRMPNRTY